MAATAEAASCRPSDFKTFSLSADAAKPLRRKFEDWVSRTTRERETTQTSSHPKIAAWRGALAGVLEATLDAMEALGADRAETVAVIGPCISQRAYEVGPEFLDAFTAEDPDFAWFFANGEGDRYLFDLAGFGLKRLRDAGIGHAEWTRHCTYFMPERFYSFRRSVHSHEADYGRLISSIRL